MSIPLTYIYNQSIETGIVPDILKVSQISPVYKGGDATDPSNYRPIATLSPFSKVLERLVYNQLYSFVDKHQIFYKYQFGFRKGYSTERAILEITDNLKLQSWTKNVKNFTLCHARGTHPVNLASWWPLPHPSLISVVKSGPEMFR